MGKYSSKILLNLWLDKSLIVCYLIIMKTEIGYVKNGKLEKLVMEHKFPAQLEIKLLALGIGRSMVRFSRPYLATPDKLNSLAQFFKPTTA